MAINRVAPTKLIPRSGGSGYKTAEFTNDDCLIDSAIPDEARNIIDLPRARGTSLSAGDWIRQNNMVYLLTNATVVINLSANATVSATSLANNFTLVQDLPGGGATVAAGNGISITTDGNISTISALPFFAKVDLFLGFRDERSDEMVTLSGTEYTAEAYLQNEGTETWYFIDGVERSGSRFITGNGLWTNADLFTGVAVDGTNSFNLIG